MSPDTGNDVAIVGMAGRFPQAPDLERFWHNLRDGVDAVSVFSEQELLEAGVSPELVRDPYYVRARAPLEDAGLFDAEFFGFSPREAALTDPQIRVFLECCWEALESAGCDPRRAAGPTAVYAAMLASTYRWHVVGGDYLDDDGGDLFRATLGANNIAGWTAYKLDLRGPSLSVQTACSSSLVAVHLAVRSLITYECDLALAGGVSILVPQRLGSRHEPGGIVSAAGRCRAFDVRADGLVGGDGVGVVLLKRLEDALAAGDPIHALIKGSAVNNDGSRKVGYTAPAVDGQADALAQALATAGVEPRSVGYIEAHGSGTPLGDLVELTALNQVYRAASREQGGIAIGSVKTNIGHIGPAAGIAGLIKAVLALEHAELPASLHFTAPHPRLPFEQGPFRVNAELAPWPAPTPRRAGVSSFGLGGTNAHVVLEQAPTAAGSEPARPWQLLLLSARNPAALERAGRRLSAHLEQPDEPNLADLAYTLQVGRRAFEHRRMLVCHDLAQAREELRADHRGAAGVARAPARRVPLAFLLPGVGDHYPDLGRELYESEPEFARHVDYCSQRLARPLGGDLRAVLYPTPRVRHSRASGAALDLRRLLRPPDDAPGPALRELRRTLWAQPAMFVVEYALARLWMSWGLVPEALIGYSLGEYVAACLAGVMSLDDGLHLLAERARLIEALPVGATLSIAATADELQPLLEPGVTLTAVLAPALCVVAGAPDAVARLEERLAREGIVSRRVPGTHAFHSPAMAAVADDVTRAAASIALHPPRIPYISNVTGTWISAAQATDPGYWAQHLCRPVQFAAGLACLDPATALVELGAGSALGSLARQQTPPGHERAIVASLPAAFDDRPDRACVLEALGRLWLGGVEPDWSRLHAPGTRRRLRLPTYPFERTLHWISTPAAGHARSGPSAPCAMVEQVRAPAPHTDAPTDPDTASAEAPVSARIRARIAAVWEQLFGIAPREDHEDFFQMGGNSLLAVRVASELRDAFQIELTPTSVLRAPRLDHLTALVEEALLASLEEMGDGGTPPPLDDGERNA